MGPSLSEKEPNSGRTRKCRIISQVGFNGISDRKRCIYLLFLSRYDQIEHAALSLRTRSGVRFFSVTATFTFHPSGQAVVTDAFPSPPPRCKHAFIDIFLSRRGFNMPTTRPFSSSFANSRSRAFPEDKKAPQALSYFLKPAGIRTPACCQRRALVEDSQNTKSSEMFGGTASHFPSDLSGFTQQKCPPHILGGRKLSNSRSLNSGEYADVVPCRRWVRTVFQDKKHALVRRFCQRQNMHFSAVICHNMVSSRISNGPPPPVSQKILKQRIIYGSPLLLFVAVWYHRDSNAPLLSPVGVL